MQNNNCIYKNREHFNNFQYSNIIYIYEEKFARYSRLFRLSKFSRFLKDLLNISLIE